MALFHWPDEGSNKHGPAFLASILNQTWKSIKGKMHFSTSYGMVRLMSRIRDLHDKWMQDPEYAKAYEVMDNKLAAVHPGEILREEMLPYLDMDAEALANHLGIEAKRFQRILEGAGDIDADTALRLGAAFNQSPRFWLNLQAQYDLAVAEPVDVKPVQWKDAENVLVTEEDIERIASRAEDAVSKFLTEKEQHSEFDELARCIESAKTRRKALDQEIADFLNLLSGRLEISEKPSIKDIMKCLSLLRDVNRN